MANPVGRVCIALDNDMLDAPSTMTWTRIDDTPNLVAGIDISVGRQSEQDQTETGSATVYLNDKAGLFDPNNTGSTYFGKLHGKPIALQLWDPVTETWQSRFRGTINNYGWDISPSQVVSNVQIECVDLFDYLGNAQAAPGIAGDVPPKGAEAGVWYEDAHADDRIIQALTDASVDSESYVVFSLNVRVQERMYDVSEVYLNIIREASEAEFPTIANCYCDRSGRFVVHGRYARFDPDSVAATAGTWDFNRWKIGDGAAIVADSERAQVRGFSFSQARADIINAALAYPRGIKPSDMPGQVVTDATSIGKYGIHSWSAPDLIVLEGTTTGNDANDECKLYSQFQVDNLASPRTRITTLNLKALHPDDPRATATWGLLGGHDISDIVNVAITYPGGVSTPEDFYIEGGQMQIRPLNPDFDMVDLSLNVSPAAWYLDNVFS